MTAFLSKTVPLKSIFFKLLKTAAWTCFVEKSLWIWLEMITVKLKCKNSKPLPPQPLGMFWSISRNRIITLFFVVRWVMFKPVFVAAPTMALWNCHLFIQHRLFVDSWTVVFLSHARPLTHRCGGGGVILGFRFLSVVFAEERRDITTRRRRRIVLDAGLGTRIKKH